MGKLAQRPRGAPLDAPRDDVLAAAAEALVEVVVGDRASQSRAGLDREAVVQAAPDAGVADLGAQVVRGREVARLIEGWLALDVDVDRVRAEEAGEDLDDRRGDRRVRGRVLRVVGGGDERPPAGLLDGGWVAVVKAGRGSSFSNSSASVRVKCSPPQRACAPALR